MWPHSVHSHEEVKEADLHDNQPIYEAPVNSLILSPGKNEVVECAKGKEEDNSAWGEKEDKSMRGKTESQTDDNSTREEDEEEHITVKGVAIPAGGHRIAKMEVFCGGRWHQVPQRNMECIQQPPGRAWAWTMWSIDIGREFLHPDGDGKITLACRATGENYATQDNSSDMSTWNMRGYLNNRYHTVAFQAEM
jgi:hypothetical protein